MLKLLTTRPSVETLLERWTADAATFAAYGQDGTAAIVAKMAGELREALDTTPAAAMAQAAPQEPATGLLGVEEAAARLGLSASWLYRNRAALPFARKIGARLLFDAAGLTKWSEGQRVASAA